MTTSVDILFRELPAPSAASERIGKHDTSSVTSDYADDRSYISRKNDSSEKSFTQHLDDQDETYELPVKNERAEIQARNPKETPQETSSEDPEFASYENKGAEENNAAPEKSNDQTGDVSPQVSHNNEGKEQSYPENNQVFTNVGTIENTPGQSVITEGKNTEPNTGKIENTVVSENTSDNAQKNIFTASGNSNPDNTNNNIIPQSNGLAFDAGSTADSGQKSALNGAPVQPQVSQNTTPQTPPEHKVANAGGEQSDGDPLITAKLSESPLNTVVSEDNNTAEAGKSNQGGMSASVKEILAGENSEKTVLPAPLMTAMEKAPPEEVAPQESGVMISAMAKAMRDEVANSQLMEKPVSQPELVATESTKSLPFAVVQSQNNAQKSTAASKKSASPTDAPGATKATNMSAAASANNQAAANPVTLQAITKSDIQFDLGMVGQKFDQALPQNTAPSGQPAISTVGLLATQDVNFQKAVANLGATMKSDAPVTAKMINEQITVAINKNVVKGLNNFSIRLHPAELGQVDIRLEFAADGKMHAAMVVQNEKTLTLLQRDQGMLEKALQDAGINLSNKDLSFSLMKQNQENNSQKSAGLNNPTGDEGSLDDLLQVGTIQDVRMGYSNRAVDISV